MTAAAGPRVLIPKIALFLLVLFALAPATAAAAEECRKTSLPEIESEVMCPICGVPLVNAGGQQAENERDFIRGLVDECQNEVQIKAALVDEYGDEVLAVPKTEGFGLAAYIVPVAGIALAGVALALGALRWRRGRDEDHETAAHESTAHQSAAQSPAPADAAGELDSDIQKYDL